MPQIFKTLADATRHIDLLEWQHHHLVRACTAIIITENRKRDAAKKRGDVFRRSRAGRLAGKALDTLKQEMRFHE